MLDRACMYTSHRLYYPDNTIVLKHIHHPTLLNVLWYILEQSHIPELIVSQLITQTT
jgi:biotin synthase-related radical SAM superfamily protein